MGSFKLLWLLTLALLVGHDKSVVGGSPREADRLSSGGPRAPPRRIRAEPLATKPLGADSHTVCSKADGEVCDDFTLRDDDNDGRVTRQEYAWGSHGGTDEAFACLDADMNGFITREERDALKTRFYKSRLSMLNEEEVLEWLFYRKCVPTDLSKHADRVQAAQLNGLALWEFGVKNPALLKRELGIESAITRRTIVQAVCREIEGLGCLGPPATQEVAFSPKGSDSGNDPSEGAPSQPQDGSGMDNFFNQASEGGRDFNADGQVSMAEFVRDQASSGPAVSEAFACLDPDDNGQITREEMFELKTRFFRSRFSHLTTEEVLRWLQDSQCVPVDMKEHLETFKNSHINGLSLWKYGVKNPSLLRSVLGITSEIKRATLTQAICREIEGSGCLKELSSKGHDMASSSDGSESIIFQIIVLIFGVGFSVICPLFRANKSREVVKNVESRILQARKDLRGLWKRVAVGSDGTRGYHSSISTSKTNGAASTRRRGSTATEISPFQGPRDRLQPKMRKTNSFGSLNKLKRFDSTSAIDGLESKGSRPSAARNDDDDTLHGPPPKKGVPRSISDLTDLQTDRDVSFTISPLKDSVAPEKPNRNDQLSRSLNPSLLRGGPNANGTNGHSTSVRKEPTPPKASANGHGWHAQGSTGSMGETIHAQPGQTYDSSRQAAAQSKSDESLDSVNSVGVDRKACNHPSCQIEFSKYSWIRKLQRHRCKSCNRYFCSAHKKRAHHACKSYLQEVNQNPNIKQTIALWSYGQIPQPPSSDDEDDEQEDRSR